MPMRIFVLSSVVSGSFCFSSLHTKVSFSCHRRHVETSLGVATTATTTYDEDVNARSSFGTRAYWDDVYQGMGDFPPDEYSWYYGYDVIKPYLSKVTSPSKSPSILLPGIGNDPMLLDLHANGYTNLVAFDYSEHAIERQKDLLSYEQVKQSKTNKEYGAGVELHHMDARFLKSSWTERFDVILEKGALDAIYLSGDGNVEASVLEMDRVLKPGGFVISVSGVVPNDIRRTIFADYIWIRDGAEDLRAGCFVFQKPI
jgi:SAM-dependent methyltransferase